METGRPTWRSRTWIGAGALLLLLVSFLATIGVDQPVTAWAGASLVTGLALLVLSWALLRTRRQRLRYEEELAAWSAERARQAERLRIAGDLHDLVSHGLGLITVRAAVARRASGPEASAERAAALADIEGASRETTTELRRMLTVLRSPGAAPLSPAASLTDLPAMIRAAREAGLNVTARLAEGPAAGPAIREISAGVQLTACAVVREALHNALRHAGPTEVDVEVRREETGLVVAVRDAGPLESWQPGPGAGHGLDGLRERVIALGGTLEAGHDGAGFRVLARLPDEERP